MYTTQYRTYNINDLLFVFTFGLYQLFLHEDQEYFNMPVKGHSLVLTLLFETMGQMHKQYKDTSSLTSLLVPIDFCNLPFVLFIQK